MPAALVANTAQQSTTNNSVTTAAIDTTGATLLVVAISYNSVAGPVTPTDSKSNTWVQAVQSTRATAEQTAIYYVKNPTVGPGHTFTESGATNYPTILVTAFSGTDTTLNVDKTSSTSVDGTVAQPGSVTPSADGEVLVTSLGGSVSSSITYSINSGFTITNQLPLSPTLAYAGAMAYLIQTSAAAINPQWTASASETLDTGIGTWRASTQVSSPASPRLMLMGVGV